MELELYTGSLTYKEILFSFSFFKGELRLIPPQDKINEIYKWGLKELANGSFTNGDPILIEDEYLVGTLNETGQSIVFFHDGQAVGKYNETLRVSIFKYLIINNENNICGLDFYSEEIELIYPPNKTFEGYQTNKETGDIIIHTKKSNSRDDNIRFNHKGTDVSLYFSCERKVKMYGGKHPIAVNSVLSLTFKETNDYSFIIDLYQIVEKMLKFMFNTKHISSQNCAVLSLYESGHSHKSGDLYTPEPYLSTIEDIIVEKKKYIKYDYLKCSFSEIMQDIADDKLYLRHLPNDYEDSRIITPSRFVMIVSGFENLFELKYPQGVVHSKSTIQKNKKFIQLIEQFKETANLNSDMRRQFDRIVNDIERDSVKTRLEYVYKCNKDLIDFFAKFPFQLNHVTFDFKEVATNVQKYRNLFAHGGIFDDFDINAFLGLILLEKINYIMHLNYYEIPEILIKKSINDLFHCNLMIND